MALSPVFVECATSLEEWLVDPSTTRYNAHRRTCTTRDGLLRTRGESYPRLVVLWRVTDDSGVVPRGACEGTAVADLFLDVAHDRTFGALADREDVTDCKGGFFTAVDEGAGVEALRGDECLGAELVAVGVAEDDASKGCTTTRKCV